MDRRGRWKTFHPRNGGVTVFQLSPSICPYCLCLEIFGKHSRRYEERAYNISLLSRTSMLYKPFSPRRRLCSLVVPSPIPSLFPFHRETNRWSTTMRAAIVSRRSTSIQRAHMTSPRNKFFVNLHSLITYAPLKYFLCVEAPPGSKICSSAAGDNGVGTCRWHRRSPNTTSSSC
jgi:hypothetical protein